MRGTPRDARSCKPDAVAELRRENERLRHRLASLERLAVGSADILTVAFQTSPNWVAVSSLQEGRYLAVNEEFLRQTGYTREEALGHTVEELGTWADPAERRAMVGTIRRTGVVRSLVVRRRAKDGREFRTLLSAQRLFFAGQECLIATSHDITDHHVAELALAESEQKYRSLVEHAQEGILVIQDCLIKFANPQAITTFGFPSQEILGRPFTDFLHPEDLPLVTGRHRQRLAGGREPTRYAFRALDQEGRTRWLSLRLADIEWEGRPAFLAFLADVTQSRLAEEALRASEERYRLIVETANEGMWLLGPDLRTSFVNRKLAELLNYPLEEMLGRPVYDFVHPDDMADVARRLDERRRGLAANFERRFMRRDGSTLWAQVAATPLMSPDGELTGILALLGDITAVKIAEERRRALERQLRQAQKMEALGTLAGGIAHDFNNILGLVLGYAEMALEAERRGRGNRGELEQIVLASDRARKLVRQILTFSRRVETDLALLEFNREIVRILALLERTLPKMVAISTELARDLWPIRGDASQLEHVLINLATNAADAMPHGGRLTIATANLNLGPAGSKEQPDLAPGPYVRLVVEDTGEGIPPEMREHVFEPFFTTKGAGGGTGLGLATVYGIVKSHRGHVTCASRAGRGTVFTIYLPVASAPEPIAEGGAPAVEDGLGGDELLLLVDDEEAILAATREALERYGYRVLAAATGEMALAIYGRQKGKIALVLLDLNMPGMGGIKCLGRLLQLDPRARVVVASGYVDEAARAEAKAAGAKEIIGKPYRFVELLSKIRRCLDAA